MAICCNKGDLEKELKEITEKLKVLKQEYQQLLVENLQKDLIIRQIKSKNIKEKFINYEKVLSKSCIEKLNVISSSARDDSQFVAAVLTDLYKGDIDQIKKLCLSGHKNKCADITEISTENKGILESIFKQRLSYISCVEDKRTI